MALIKSSKQLVQEAQQKIENLSFEEVVTLLGNSNVCFVDIREINEINQYGTIPGSLHIPRGILEFVVDPESPYFNAIFQEDMKIILFCRSSWRSALATLALQEMGIYQVAHLSGGFDHWVESGGEILLENSNS